MSEFNFEVAGGESIRLSTAGKYCDRDIVVTGTGGGGDTSIEDGIIDRTISGDYVNDRVTAIGGYAFRACNKMTLASFPNAKSIGAYAFYQCSQLTSAIFPVATTIYNYTFNNCINLTTIDSPAVASIGTDAFAYCSQLTSVSFPAVTTISGSVFAYCSKLASIDFPVATAIGNSAFYACYQLTSASFPAVTSIGSLAFGNSKLTQLVLRSLTVASLSNANAFNNTPIASGTGYIYVPDNLVEDYKVATNWATYASQIKPISELGE